MTFSLFFVGSLPPDRFLISFLLLTSKKVRNSNQLALSRLLSPTDFLNEKFEKKKRKRLKEIAVSSKDFFPPQFSSSFFLGKLELT
jgi:ABC-type ATPase with predicted acetyltransferase domain